MTNFEHLTINYVMSKEEEILVKKVKFLIELLDQYNIFRPIIIYRTITYITEAIKNIIVP